MLRYIQLLHKLLTIRLMQNPRYAYICIYLRAGLSYALFHPRVNACLLLADLHIDVLVAPVLCLHLSFVLLVLCLYLFCPYVLLVCLCFFKYYYNLSTILN